ncbi:MAG: hypothetical protein ABIB93_00480 [Chloroflexota bacterium]
MGMGGGGDFFQQNADLDENALFQPVINKCSCFLSEANLMRAGVVSLNGAQKCHLAG